MRDLDLRRLRMFMAVVDAPSLRVAAERLYISQQALSVAIRELERQLDVELFSRSRRTLTPTPAGVALYEGAIPLLAGGSNLAAEVKMIDDNKPDPFSIGHTPGLAPSEVFQVIEGAVLADPSLLITVKPLWPGDIRDAIMSGDVDMVLARSHTAPTDLAGAIATRHELRLAVNADNPLSENPTCAMRDLADHPIVVSELEDDYKNMIVSYCRRAGFEPEIVVSNLRGTPPHMSVITHPDACAFVTNQPGWLYQNQIRVVSFDDPPMTPVMAMWLPNTASRIRNAILDAVGITDETE
ncbi:putative LysR family transcriptional regulator [Gordonia polyisoprenivorans NBRC 16320 = JCM 10675]|uniref:LysR family transcriptional regulator n=1 Tax=Gordonia polyisoprenivorans TaxID=84595 RepID=A0A846WSM8_9ACTN|nr:MULTISPECIES: LysR family transcriptional regulator [Gordonia]MBE7195386.1 LysR family transcriptional regulator [Gordonia polyisoprenivorans]MDF3283908.1 LysR family transcriptional regulator [Gordonia sp. N1V]NKY04535.1 LysR family transcriptional regulator [Gordonia polyisoprenivorans]OZC32508.1 LysR family transcriptional regulator [Gordonia polyisoprenivorans]QUD83209.1 LysR family transcriptional regulator [Gordonia polyisoprenivorans]